MEIKLKKNGSNFMIDPDSEITFDDAITMLMNGLATIIKQYIRAMEKHASDKHALHENMYDRMDALFAKLLQEIFPDIQIREFDLLTAAIVKAQDDIINMAEEKGMTYQEALDYYNDISNEYIKKRSLN